MTRLVRVLLVALVFGVTGSASTGCTDGVLQTGADGGVDSDTDTHTDTWSQAMDEFWGEAPDLETRLALFDDMWSELDQEYAAFVTTPNLDWDDVHATYRPAVEQAVLFGELVNIFNEVFTLLQDSHTFVFCDEVCLTPLRERPPMFIQQYWSPSHPLGVCVTALEDDTMLVYRVEEDNPAGLQPGDRLLGYDGVPWRQLLDQLEDANIPSCRVHGTADSVEDRHRMESVVNNPHLFAELDFIRYGTDSVVSVSTDDLIEYTSTLACTGQVAVNGVGFPWTDYLDWHYVDGTEQDVSWGIVEGTNIGYIYVYSWISNTEGGLFADAVEALMSTDGLIIDQRFNVGGGMLYPFDGMSLLFNQDLVNITQCGTRSDPDDRNALEYYPWSTYDFHADPETFYDRPIAILTGPRAGSSGDYFPYYMVRHPRAQRFGRPTIGAFGAGSGFLWNPNDPYLNAFYSRYMDANCVDSDGNFLHRTEQVPETPVWLTADDVAAGIDTVVEAALEWIGEQNQQ